MDACSPHCSCLEKVGKDKIKDEVFMVGLLRQIGKSMLANQYPEEYVICYDMAEEGVDEEKLHQLEKMKWGITSADASHVAMQTWNFPESLLNSSQVLRYNITNLEQLEKEQPHLLPVVIAEYIVLLGNYTNTIKLSEKLKSKLMDQVGKLSIIYGIDEEKQRFYLDELRREIREDSFYSFCGELFTN
ncbi:MAG TPA: HDOD domain-containing protein [Turneriella sp.]|nr:HDOD domain-containing protein [Turneriella sp.]